MNEELPLTVSDLFCMTQGTINSGPRQCHWCRALTANDPKFRHDDNPPMPFVKSKYKAQCPAEPYTCFGCWSWRRKFSTVYHLDGTFQDSQKLTDNSWWMTEDDCFCVSPNVPRLTEEELTDPKRKKCDLEILSEKLLHPPAKWVLTFHTDPKIPNLLHLCILNDNAPGSLTEETPLHFTVDNIPHTFTIYELRMGLRKGGEVNMEPGTRYLVELFRPFYPLEAPEGELEPDKRGRGRPRNDTENRPNQKKV